MPLEPSILAALMSIALSGLHAPTCEHAELYVDCILADLYGHVGPAICN